MRHNFMDPSRGQRTINHGPSLNTMRPRSPWELSCYTGGKEWESENTGFNYVYFEKSEKSS